MLKGIGKCKVGDNDIAYFTLNAYVLQSAKLRYVSIQKVVCTALKWWLPDYMAYFQQDNDKRMVLKSFETIGTGLTAGDLDILPIDSYVSRLRKLHYISTPKVACTSLKWWFARLEGYDLSLADLRRSLESDPDLAIHDLLPVLCPSIVPNSREEERDIFDSADYFRFAVVRNPYKRLFSAWQSKLLLREPLQIRPYLGKDFLNRPLECLQDIGLSFEAFLEYLVQEESEEISDPHWAPQVQVLRVGSVNYSMIAQIENAEPLWQRIAERLQGRFEHPLKYRTNESLIPYHQQFISNRSKELVAKLYADDFKHFGYSKELPQSKESFGNPEFDVAMKAVLMIRGRNKRFGEVRGLLAESDLLSSQEATLALKNEIDKYESWGKEQAKQVVDLQSVLASYVRDIEALKGSLLSSEAEKGALREEIGKYEAWGKEQAKQVVDLQSVLANYVRDIEALKGNLLLSEAGKGALRDEIGKYEAWGKEQAKQVGELQSVLGNYVRDIEALKGNLLSSEAEKGALRDEIGKYDAWGKEQAKQVVELQGVLGNYVCDIEALKNNLSLSEAEKGALREDVSRLMAEKSVLIANINAVVRSLSRRITAPFRKLFDVLARRR